MSLEESIHNKEEDQEGNFQTEIENVTDVVQRKMDKEIKELRDDIYREIYNGLSDFLTDNHRNLEEVINEAVDIIWSEY